MQLEERQKKEQEHPLSCFMFDNINTKYLTFLFSQNSWTRCRTVPVRSMHILNRELHPVFHLHTLLLQLVSKNKQFLSCSIFTGKHILETFP